MPHWDFQCPDCRRVVDLSFQSYEAMMSASPHCDDCLVLLERQASAPAFKVAATVQTKTEMKNGLKVTTTIRGNETIDDYV